jgi:hypothetical protein
MDADDLVAILNGLASSRKVLAIAWLRTCCVAKPMTSPMKPPRTATAAPPDTAPASAATNAPMPSSLMRFAIALPAVSPCFLATGYATMSANAFTICHPKNRVRSISTIDFVIHHRGVDALKYLKCCLYGAITIVYIL